MSAQAPRNVSANSPANPPANSPSAVSLLLGWIMTLVPAALLVMSGLMKLKQPDDLIKGFEHLGWPLSVARWLGIVELICAALLLIPQTAVLGAILVTGYLGGAIATHVRIEEFDKIKWIAPLGVLVWLGLYFRDLRVREVAPLRNGGILGMLKSALIGLVLILAVFAVAVALQPADFTITRSMLMGAPADKIFASVNDFHKWEPWSPWAKLDPECKYTYSGAESGEGAEFAWESQSNQVGQGNMKIVKSHPSDELEMDLEFIKPMPGNCHVYFTFEPEGDQTKVTWKMTGKNNFMGKAFALVCDMDKMVGDDFTKGLSSLKGVVEVKQLDGVK